MPRLKNQKISLETKLKVTIHWLDPPEDEKEKFDRAKVQANIQHTANLLAQDINKFVFNELRKAGVLKPIINGDNNGNRT